MRVKTVSPGLDLRSEPPADLIAYLVEKSEKRQPLTLEDCLRLAKLPVRQWQALLGPHIPGIRPALGLYRVERLYRVLHFYANLSREQRAQAESERGLALREMDLRVQSAFRRIANVGMPKRVSGGEPQRQAGFYVRRDEKGDGVTYTFLIVSERKPPLTTACLLALASGR
jgi:hypothetical protein